MTWDDLLGSTLIFELFECGFRKEACESPVRSIHASSYFYEVWFKIGFAHHLEADVVCAVQKERPSESIWVP